MMARFTKVVFAAALVCALCLPAVAAQSATDLTGKHWLPKFLMDFHQHLYTFFV